MPLLHLIKQNTMKTQTFNTNHLLKQLCGFTLILLLASCNKKEQVTPLTVIPEPKPKPEADFIMSIDGDRAPASVSFYNNSHNASEYKWDFGDGTNSSNTSPLKIYSKGGIYTVRLTAVNETGTNTMIKNLTIGKQSESLKITSVTVTNMKLSGYDLSFPELNADPDMYFNIYAENAHNLMYSSPVVANVRSLPVNWAPNNELNFADVPDMIYSIQFWDQDQFSTDDAMDRFTFKPADYMTREKYYPQTITLTNGSATITLGVEWQ